MRRPDSPDWSDVQRLVVSGYGRLPHAKYLLFHITDVPVARRILKELVPHVTDARAEAHVTPPSRDVALNVAFTYTGIRKLADLPSDEIRGFVPSFEEGMTGTVHRSRVLGDFGPNDPRHWSWGRPSGDARDVVDGVLMMFAGDPERVCEYETELRARLEGVLWLYLLPACLRPSARPREPFGFADGLSQPLLEGTRLARRRPDSPHVVKVGEILLGYEDNAGHETPVPALRCRRDFGLNGTYLVMRQLQQDVAAFEAYLGRASASLGLTPAALAAKMMGRTYDGDVLVPGAAPRPLSLGNDFGFAADRDGLGCPLGAHIRRGNPRDMLGSNATEGWRVANRHRVLRRGRPYDHDGHVGLMFVALNADPERQFEFIQQNWVNDDGFAELGRERDPFIGWRDGDDDTFTIPAVPARRRIHGLGQFVTVKGGAYFFLPGLRGLRDLLSEPPS